MDTEFRSPSPVLGAVRDVDHESSVSSAPSIPRQDLRTLKAPSPGTTSAHQTPYASPSQSEIPLPEPCHQPPYAQSDQSKSSPSISPSNPRIPNPNRSGVVVYPQSDHHESSSPASPIRPWDPNPHNLGTSNRSPTWSELTTPPPPTPTRIRNPNYPGTPIYPLSDQTSPLSPTTSLPPLPPSPALPRSHAAANSYHLTPMRPPTQDTTPLSPSAPYPPLPPSPILSKSHGAEGYQLPAVRSSQDVANTGNTNALPQPGSPDADQHRRVSTPRLSDGQMEPEPEAGNLGVWTSVFRGPG